MPVILTTARVLAVLISWVLALGRKIAVILMALMVLVILIQVFYRYVLNSALPWPDEAARFMMLWLTGLVAPSAYRLGGFVAIEMVPQLLPRTVGAVLSLILLCLAGLVLVVATQLGWNHVNSGWLFNSASLKLPLDLIGMEVVRIKLAWMYMSLFVGVCLLLAVNVELILRAIATLAGRGEDLPEINTQSMLGAE
ncbi:MAG: TRAP transporter small permease [Litoreibacter sp.]|nr:TRAP transporter small permease [Litoreibacter sp.]